jgi:hypothetical protein
MVIEQAILFSATDNMEDAMAMADEGNFSGAKRSLDLGTNFLKANNYYVNSSAELKRMDSTNVRYANELSRIRSNSKDSIHLVQKRYRDETYKLRNKKQ